MFLRGHAPIQSLHPATRLFVGCCALGYPSFKGSQGINGIGDVSKLNRGIAPAFPIYFVIIWALPNTMQIFGRFPVSLIPDRFSNQISRTSSLNFLRFRMTPFSAVVSIIIFLMGWFSLSNLSPFIYFQF